VAKISKLYGKSKKMALLFDFDLG